ncbi:MAG: murein L,D-transpeptidase catalytic domain family protein [Sphingobacteriales bacterium]|nr:murein L,D-transpeptidase catalytic domain family protein [Sphingobacteriales bacterium]
MKISRLLILVLIIIVAASWLSQTKLWKRTKALYIPQTQKDYSLTNRVEEKLQQKAAEGKIFVQQKKYNDNICFLIDMSLSSGQNRFFIYDLKNDSLFNSGLVAHGNCYEYWLEGRKYSNVVGSGCTSLGKYKIGIHYTGKFGYSYKLHGLDTTNNNAFERTVVLHAHSCIPETEVPDEICQSNGCPTVSPNFLEQLKTIINQSKKPVLLWIYE